MKKTIQRIKEALKQFFFPPEGASKQARVLPDLVLGVLTVAALAGGSYGWEYTNSPDFCGTDCHTMPPQYSAYLASPHARVQCVECHIGPGADWFVQAKISGLRQVLAVLADSYSRPIPAPRK